MDVTTEWGLIWFWQPHEKDIRENQGCIKSLDTAEAQFLFTYIYVSGFN